MNHLELKFKALDFGSNSYLFGVRCYYSDYITVSQREIISNEWTVLLNKLCTIDQVTDQIVGTNVLKLDFASNAQINGTGFEAIVYERK